MNRKQALTLSRHLDDIARIPSAQKNTVVDLLYSGMERVVSFMGQFIENNPGKVLFMVSTTTIILINSDGILDRTTVVYDERGNPAQKRNGGLLERLLHPVISELKILLYPVAAALSAWLEMILWFSYERKKPGPGKKQPARAGS